MIEGYCIIVTKLRLYQGVVLYRSLRHHLGNPRVFMLCMDDETYEILGRMGLENVTLIHISELEDDLLRIKRAERKLNEYCWTMKPILLEHVLKRFCEVKRVHYLDADLCFFNSPKTFISEGKNYSVMLSKHNYIKQYGSVEEICGKYNSGYISFNGDEIGLHALQWWKLQCLHWCFDRVEAGRFGDQKYLDNLAREFPSVLDIHTPGVNIGPWNDARYKSSVVNGKVHINNVELIFYHFAGLRVLSKEEFAFVLSYNNNLFEHIYLPYIRILQEVIEQVSQIRPSFNGFSIEENRRGGIETIRVAR